MELLTAESRRGKSELSEDPAVLFGDLVDNVLLQIAGEDAPSVGFDFKVRAEIGMGAAVSEEVGDVVVGGTQGRGWFRIEWDVKVDSRFARSFKFQI